MSRNQVVDDTPNNPSEASVHRSRGEEVEGDRSLVEDRNALEDQRPEGVVVVHRYPCW